MLLLKKERQKLPILSFCVINKIIISSFLIYCLHDWLKTKYSNIYQKLTITKTSNGAVIPIKYIKWWEDLGFFW